MLKTDAAETLEAPALKAAKGEHEAFQLILRGGSTAVNSITISVSSLTSTGGASIPASAVTVYKSVYVPAAGKEYPDALPPYTGAFNLSAGQTQPIWFDVSVPKTATAGDYAGTVTLTDANEGRATVPFTVHVYDFALPDTPKLATRFGLWWNSIEQVHGVTRESEPFEDVVDKYIKLMLDHRVSMDYFPVDYMSAAADKYFKDPRVSSFTIPNWYDNSKKAQVLARIKGYGQAIWDKHIFYPVDEPYTQADYSKMLSTGSQLKAMDPDVNIMATYYRGPNFGSQTIQEALGGVVNHWCAITDFHDADQLAVRRAMGDKIWSYVATGPILPYCNYNISYEALEHRMLPWCNYLYEATGLLYWSITYWEHAGDVWTNTNTVGEPEAAGGGSLLYPGTKVGINGPVTSMRFEMLRDSIEDYDYLMLLEQKRGRAAVLSYVRQLAQSWTSYTKDKTLFQEVRDSIARSIEN